LKEDFRASVHNGVGFRIGQDCGAMRRRERWTALRLSNLRPCQLPRSRLHASSVNT
jgi:hypothetical protein